MRPNHTTPIRPAAQSARPARRPLAAWLVGAALALAIAPGALAQDDGRGTQEEQQACMPDVFRLCQAEIPNEPRIVACLKAKRAQLSPACRLVFKDDPRPARSTRHAVRPGRPMKISHQPRAAKRAVRPSKLRKADPKKRASR